MKNYKDLVLLKKDKKSWFLFKNPIEVVEESCGSKIFEKLKYIEDRVHKGFFAAGFLSYEASTAFDEKYRVNKDFISKALWFGIYKNREVVNHDEIFKDIKEPVTFKWNIDQSLDEYEKGIEFTKEMIKKGDIYQLNYTFLMDTKFGHDPFEVFKSSFANLDSKYLAFINTKTFSVLSGSPELFFSLDNEKIVSKPMKGTAPRGRNNKEDDLNRYNLFFSQKDRAENVMIVDMIRNDIGQIARTSSVKVNKLFEIEQYSRVLQMTSTVEAKTDKSVADIFKAMFPCASITGAPKIKAMEYIKKVEKRGRGLYTGSIGYIAPNRDVVFNVAIRTLYLNKEEKCGYYGTGGGIVWDSTTENEYSECMNKALIISNPEQEFELLETLLLKKGIGFYLKDYHLKRICSSALYFGFDLKKKKIEQYLNRFSLDKNLRVRLLVNRRGDIRHESCELKSEEIKKSITWKVCVSEKRVNSINRFLFHKTTNRQIYNDIKENYPDFDDVILMNEKGELTESCFANVVVKKDGELLTPPIGSGLLNGTMRQKLIDDKSLKEKILYPKDLIESDGLYLINSVRGFILVDLEI